MFPMELISAIPPAAAAPLRNDVGSDQKGASILWMPIIPRHKPSRPPAGVSEKADSTQPRELRRAGIATCRRCFPVRSDQAPLTSMAISPHTLGSAARRPISTLLEAGKRLRISSGKYRPPALEL